MSVCDSTPKVAVLKIGGSVLIGDAAYRRTAELLERRLADSERECLLVVVSAEFGTTDRLRRTAESFCSDPDPRALDLLWSTGELRSVALLTLCLQQLGVAAVGLNAHECGLVSWTRTPGAAGVETYPLRLRYFLSRHSVVVVPGFLARGPFDSTVSLGRGGSDLSAVLLAAGLGSARCELIKDVPGYYSKDPNIHDDARPLPVVTFDHAMRMADEGCELVQPAALAAARRGGVQLLVRGIEEDAPSTLVTDDDNAECAPIATVAPVIEARGESKGVA